MSRGSRGRQFVSYEVEAIGFVDAMRPHAEDDFWAGAEACITLTAAYSAHALSGLDSFSHVEVLFLFHRVEHSDIVSGTRHPRNNPKWPAVGIFAQRARNRPNRLGSTICRIVRIEGARL
jgi:tRNA (Thr-GGU) A37 N-methylase